MKTLLHMHCSPEHLWNLTGRTVCVNTNVNQFFTQASPLISSPGSQNDTWGLWCTQACSDTQKLNLNISNLCKTCTEYVSYLGTAFANSAAQIEHFILKNADGVFLRSTNSSNKTFCFSHICWFVSPKNSFNAATNSYRTIRKKHR